MKKFFFRIQFSDKLEAIPIFDLATQRKTRMLDVMKTLPAFILLACGTLNLHAVNPNFVFLLGDAINRDS